MAQPAASCAAEQFGRGGGVSVRLVALYGEAELAVGNQSEW
jgi:hypothetical protein